MFSDRRDYFLDPGPEEGPRKFSELCIVFTIFEIYKYYRVHLSSGMGGPQMFVVRNSTTPPPSPAT
jgi:hypothetical protein